jgi:Sulfotransferase domain
MNRFIRAASEGIRVATGRKPAGRSLTTFPDDIFIVSYPRSGNTWTRFLIGNLVHPEVPITFSNLEERVPEIYLFPDRTLRRLPRPRILKSHECFDPRYKKIIYIVRHPRDVAVSYYHYAIKREWIEESCPIANFVARFIMGEFDVRAKWAAAWDDHVLSWTSLRQGKPGFLLLRYEDMLLNTQNALSMVADLLDLDSTQDRITNAIEVSSADHMRTLESKEGSQWLLTKETRQDRPFVRSAKSGDWRTALPAESVVQIEAAWGPIMQTLGYVLSTIRPTEEAIGSTAL